MVCQDDTVYKKGEFLVVRSEDEGFYLCQANQDVIAEEENIKILWLVEEGKRSYRLRYTGTIPFQCILTDVNLSKRKDKFILKGNETIRVKDILKRSLDAEKQTKKGASRKESTPNTEETILSQAKQDEKLAYLRKESRMQEGILAASTPAKSVGEKKKIKPLSLHRHPAEFPESEEAIGETLEIVVED